MTRQGNMDATLFLVLSIISKGCTELTKQAKKVASTSGEISDKVALYKTQFGTQLTATFYLELSKALEHSIATITSEKHTSNIMKQYHVYYILNILNASMILLNVFNIQL